jgi:hypothetical protein
MDMIFHGWSISVAAVVDDVVEAFEAPIGSPVLAHELPDILSAIELGGAGRRREERDVGWNLELLRTVPAGSIEDENRVRPGSTLVAISSR